MSWNRFGDSAPSGLRPAPGWTFGCRPLTREFATAVTTFTDHGFVPRDVFAVDDTGYSE